MRDADRQLLRAAIDAASGGSVPRFAALLGAHHSRVYRWLHGTAQLPPDVARTCAAILQDPTHVVPAYQRAAGACGAREG